MKKNTIENIIQKQTRLSTQGIIPSDIMKSVLKMNQISNSVSHTLVISNLVANIRSFPNISKFTSMTFQQTEALRKMQNLPKFPHLIPAAFPISNEINSLKEINKIIDFPSSIFRLSDSMKQMDGIINSSKLSSIAFRQSDTFKDIFELTQLSSFRYLATLKNSPFSDNLDFPLDKIIPNDISLDQSLVDIDSQISEELSSTHDFNTLSEKTKKILLYLFHYVFLPLVLNLCANYVIENINATKKELEVVNSPAEVRAYARSNKTRIDRSVLNGFRITTANSLNLRTSPTLRSDIIDNIPLGTLVEIIDKSSKSWLFIEVEIEGDIMRGWISRRYTTYFR